MSRYIDAKWLQESLELADECKDCKRNVDKCVYSNIDVGVVCNAVDDAPSIEPKHGEWEDIDNWWESNEEIHLFRCSVCGAEMNSPIEPNFCCSCGADMRKETVDYKRVVLTCDDEGNWSMCGERKEGE